MVDEKMAQIELSLLDAGSEVFQLKETVGNLHKELEALKEVIFGLIKLLENKNLTSEDEISELAYIETVLKNQDEESKHEFYRLISHLTKSTNNH